MSETETPQQTKVALPGPVVGGETGGSPHEPRTRPWELELLISGAVVFALVQLPGQVDAWFHGADPHLDGATESAVFALYYYGKLILYTLISTFVLHLCARAYWVGLIGLESVFPRGVNWDDTYFGPIGREVYRSRYAGVQRQIDAADRLCSVLFSTAFALVALFVLSVVAGGVFALLALGVSRLVPGAAFGDAFHALAIAFLAPMMLVSPVDRWLGPRLRPDGVPARALRGLAVFYYYALGAPLYAGTVLTLFSNLKRRTFYPVFGVVLAALIGFFFVHDVLARNGALEAGSYEYLPDAPGARGMAFPHYENLRPAEGDYRRVPTIQADVVRDPYVRLFLPYSPERHNRVFRERCPGVAPLGETGLRIRAGGDPPSDAAMDAVLACWRRVQPVKLNGREIAPDFRFYTHPATGLYGIVAYLPTAGLPRGENVLEVEPVPGRRRPATPPRPWHIPFWL